MVTLINSTTLLCPRGRNAAAPTMLLAAVLTLTSLMGVGVAGPAMAADSPPTAPPGPVLPPLAVTNSTAPTPTSSGVATALGPLARGSKGSSALVVVDPGARQGLVTRSGSTPLIPASTAKLATAAAALHVLGPTHRIPTVVRQAGDVITLVGGGDPSLRLRGKQGPGEAASLTMLARDTARALGSDASIALTYDDRAFRGPALGPGWSRAFPALGVVPPISALIVDGARVSPGATSRVADPARQAALAFARLLRAEGIDVTSIAEGRVGQDSVELARVESAPVSDLIAGMLTDSENGFAEALAHLVGGAALDKPTFAGGAEATSDALDELGITVDGLDLADGSGLSRSNRMTADTLAELLSKVATGSEPTLAPIAPGLAVAGLTGTLADRFSVPATRPGRGVVQAKTGTLTGVVALAGLVRTTGGRLLVFASIQNQVPSAASARLKADEIAATLAQCGCK